MVVFATHHGLEEQVWVDTQEEIKMVFEMMVKTGNTRLNVIYFGCCLFPNHTL